MTMTTIGDLAHSFILRRQNTALKQDISRLTGALASGESEDIVRKLSGDLGYLSDVENNLALNQAFALSAREAGSFSAHMQASLERVQGQLHSLTDNLIMLGQSGLETEQKDASNAAAQQMKSIVAALNMDAAGRALFAGVATDTQALRSTDDILGELRLALSGAVTLTDVKATLDSWFDDAGGGFESFAYTGSFEYLDAFQLGAGESAHLKIRADDPALRAALKAAAMAALSKDGTIGLSADVESGMLAAALDMSLHAKDLTTSLRADLGFAEARIVEGQARLEAEASSLALARSELRGADLYDVAVQLEQAELRLEGLYTATARLSQLSLMRFLQ